MIKTYQVVATVVYKSGFEKVYKGEKMNAENAPRGEIERGIDAMFHAVKIVYRESEQGSITVGDHVIRIDETVSVSFAVMEGY